MNIFEKLEKKTTETINCATETTTKFAGDTKLKIRISNCKGKIEDLYKDIGKKVYQLNILEGREDIKENIKEEVEKISALTDEIEEYERQRMEIKDLKQCENCKSKIDRSAKYCPECGAEQPVEKVHDVEVVDLQETVEQVVEPINDETESTIEETETKE